MDEPELTGDPETDAILSDPETMAAIAEAEAEVRVFTVDAPDVPVTNEDWSRHFLGEAHAQLAVITAQSEAFSNVGLYPFENVHTSLLASIAYSLRSVNEKLEALLSANRPRLFIPSTPVGQVVEQD